MAASIAFVRLTDARDGSQVWVNFNHVWKFLKGAHGGTVIYLVPDTGGEYNAQVRDTTMRGAP